jgi:hypothetical protein
MSSAHEMALSVTARRRRLGLLGAPFAIAALGALVVLAVAAVGWRVSHYSFGYLTRDPAAITHQAPYMGMVSFFGIFAWVAGATALVCGGYAASLRGAIDRSNAQFLAAAVVGYLLLDDSFQFHEYVYPHFLHVRDTAVELAYVVAIVFAVVKGRRFLASTNIRLLVAAGIFFVISIGLDVAFESERLVALEDGSKLIGIFVLTAYCVDTALGESRRTVGELRNSAGVPRPLGRD